MQQYVIFNVLKEYCISKEEDIVVISLKVEETGVPLVNHQNDTINTNIMTEQYYISFK